MSIVPANTPCGSCPYRRDVPAGVWDESEYEKLPRYDGPTVTQPPSAFFCHQQDGRLCAGWVGCHDMQENFGLRLVAAAGRIDEEEYDAILDYETATPLFSSGAEAATHGLSGVENPPVETVRLIQRLEAKREREQSNKGELMDHYVVITTDHDYNNNRIERMTLSPADEENAWVTAHQQFEKEKSEHGEDRTVVAVIEERCVPGVLAALAAGGYGERL